MRVTTAFKRILAIPGATVRSVAFTPAGIVVGLRLRSRVLRCTCGFSSRATYDRSVRRWRHLDLGATKLFVSAEIRPLRCPACARVRTEEVPWARPGARHTKDLEDVVAYLAQRVDKTTITRLLRIFWAGMVGGHLGGLLRRTGRGARWQHRGGVARHGRGLCQGHREAGAPRPGCASIRST